MICRLYIVTIAHRFLQHASCLLPARRHVERPTGVMCLYAQMKCRGKDGGERHERRMVMGNGMVIKEEVLKMFKKLENCWDVTWDDWMDDGCYFCSNSYFPWCRTVFASAFFPLRTLFFFGVFSHQVLFLYEAGLTESLPFVMWRVWQIQFTLTRHSTSFDRTSNHIWCTGSTELVL